MERESRILIIDDDVHLASNLKVILEDEGYLAEVAHTGQEAIDICRRNDFMVCLSDIKLPDISGVDLAGQLAQVLPAMDAILITGHATLDTALAAVGNRNIIAYETKPLNIPEFLILLRQVVERKHAEAELTRYRERLELLVQERTDELRIANQKLQNEIDQREKARQILIESEEKYRAIFEQSADSIVLLDPATGEFIDFNDVAHQNLGYTRQEFQTMHVADVDALLSAEELLKHAQHVVKHGSGRAVTRQRTKQGELRHILTNTRPLRIRERDLLLSIWRDITEIEQKREVEERARELEEVNRLRSAILASVSHELRTPLAAIKGLAESLVQTDVEWDIETQREWLRTINRESDTLTRIVEDLVQMSQLEAGIMTMNKLPATISAIIDRLDHQLKVLVKDHVLQVDVPDDLPKIEVDDVRIGQVISNLVSNAAFYSSPGTRILLAVRQADDEIIVSVTDEGIGIPSEHQKKIFDRFYRVESGVSHRRGGTGLGLSICRGILDSHGGRIWVESTSEGGSTFSFSLPVSSMD